MSDRPHNAFLHGLSHETFERLRPELSVVDLPQSQVLFRVDETVEWVYFPETVVMSLLSDGKDGQVVETFMAGCEGGAGLLEASGSGKATLNCIVQVDGRALRAPAAFCRSLVRSDPGFGDCAWRLIEMYMGESRQSGLCQAFHAGEPRLARWLTETWERSGGRNSLPLTQEFLAAMLGVQRTTVTGFATRLQQSGLIDYHRGRLEIVDRIGLERRACECREVVQQERVRLGFDVRRL